MIYTFIQNSVNLKVIGRLKRVVFACERDIFSNADDLLFDLSEFKKVRGEAVTHG